MIENVIQSSPESIADYIEWYVLFHNKSISKSKLLSLLEDTKEETVDDALNEIGRRVGLYGDSSPINTKGNRIIPRKDWQQIPEMIMCLIFSLQGVENIAGQDNGTKLFEQLCREAVKGYLGGEIQIIGFPNNLDLKTQIENLCLKMKERLGDRIPNSQDKDKGVDLIAWLSHGDGRPNQVALLVQCAAGTNFSSKKSISSTAWGDFINWSVKPLCSIAIPKIPSSDEFIEIRDDYSLIFDRVRLIRGIDKNTSRNITLFQTILDWCKAKLSKYESLPMAS